MRSKMLAKELLAVLAIASLVFLVGCGGNTSQPPPPSQPTAVTVSPSSATVQTGGVQQFTATVTNTSNLAVTWSLTQGGTACSPTCGTVSPTSTASSAPTAYTAPATAPTPATVTLTATSATDATRSASAAITVTAPAPADLAKLTGPYAFLFNGFDSGGAVVIAGSFTADGNGNITGGIEDSSWVSGVSTSVSFTGTYTVGADNRGSMTLTSTTPAVTSTFGFALGGFATGVATKGRFQGTFATAGADGVGQLE